MVIILVHYRPAFTVIEIQGVVLISCMHKRKEFPALLLHGIRCNENNGDFRLIHTLDTVFFRLNFSILSVDAMTRIMYT